MSLIGDLTQNRFQVKSLFGCNHILLIEVFFFNVRKTLESDFYDCSKTLVKESLNW